MEINYKKKHFWYVLLFAISLASLFINLNVSMNEKLVFGDEGYYAARGEYMSENWELPKNWNIYSKSEVFEKYDVRPPMIKLAITSFNMLGGKMAMRFFMPFISFLSGLFLFLLVKKIYNPKAGVFAVLFYFSVPALITHSIFLYPELLSLMWGIASLYFLYSYFEKENLMYLITSTILLSFAILTESSAMIFIIIFVLSLFLYKKNLKDWSKEVSIVLAITILITTPSIFLHNYRMAGDPGYKLGRLVNKIPGVDVEFSNIRYKKDLPEFENVEFEKRTEVARGTNAPLHRYGLLNYINFAYTLPIFLFVLLGFSVTLVDTKRKNLFILIWAVVYFFSVYLIASGTRVENLSRNTLQIIAPLSIAAGFFGYKIYDYLKSFETIGKTIAVLFLVIVLVWSFSTTITKAETLRPIKRFSDAFFKGCDWIRENTPSDSLVYTLWRHRAEYHCKRGVVGNKYPGMEDAILLANGTSYEIIEEHGIDYLFLQKTSIKRGEEADSYPLKFVQYIESSSHYQKVHQYPQNCLYKQNVADCIVVYEVTEDINQTNEQKISIPEELQ